MKPLTEKMARLCEEAGGPVCHCRCGGALHGVARGGQNPDRSFYEALPEDDPHHLYTALEIALMREARREAKRKERDEADKRKWEYISRTLYRD